MRLGNRNRGESNHAIVPEIGRDATLVIRAVTVAECIDFGVGIAVRRDRDTLAEGPS